MNKSKIIVVLFLILVYVISTGISYALFSGGSTSVVTNVPPPSKSAAGDLLFDPSLPKTEPCPLNGAKYSTQQKAWWEKHRPLGVMIENHEESRPQSGLSSADIIYEAVAEGGITRFLVIFYCQDASIIGPVRSARTYFVDFVSEYGEYPLYAHVGGANTPGPANALGQIADYGWNGYNDLEQFSLGCPVFCRDETRLGRKVATEHTMYSGTSKLWEVAKEREITNVDADGNSWDENYIPYDFKEDASAGDRGSAQTIHIEFWPDYLDYAVDWKYDPTTNSYLRTNGGEPHVDLNTKKQISAKNIVVLSMVESNANDGYENNAHLLYRTKGTGKATIFMDGQEIDGTWRKRDRESKLEILDESGNPVEFNRGLLWFEILPTEGVLTVK